MNQKPIRSVCFEGQIEARVIIDVIKTKRGQKVVLKTGEITCELGEILGIETQAMPTRDCVQLRPHKQMDWRDAFRTIISTTAALDEITMVVSVARKLTKENQNEDQGR